MPSRQLALTMPSRWRRGCARHRSKISSRETENCAPTGSWCTISIWYRSRNQRTQNTPGTIIKCLRRFRAIGLSHRHPRIAHSTTRDAYRPRPPYSRAPKTMDHEIAIAAPVGTNEPAAAGALRPRGPLVDRLALDQQHSQSLTRECRPRHFRSSALRVPDERYERRNEERTCVGTSKLCIISIPLPRTKKSVHRLSSSLG